MNTVWCRLLIFILFAAQFVRCLYLDIGVEVQQQCINTCKLQNHTDASHCGDIFDCNAQCELGCNIWKVALNSSCQKVCNATEAATLSQKEFNCVIGCNSALTRYYTELRIRLGTPPAPALVADSLTSTSLRLEWNFPAAREAGLRYFLQWRYEEHAGAWQYCRNQSWGRHETVYVDNLQPYTKYRFRVALILSNLTDPIVSPPSVVISTRPGGVPASAPIIQRAVAVDSSRISISWEPGPFPHGPILSYVLQITDNQPPRYSALKDLPADRKSYMFRNLNHHRNYTVSIQMRNSAGAGPAANVTVSTPVESKPKDSEKPILILGAHHVVIEQGTEMQDESVILYNTNEFITGIAIHVSKRLLFVSDSARYVHRMPLHEYVNHTTNTAIIRPSQMNFIPLDLSMDWLGEQLYILGEVPHEPKVWQISRCNLNGEGLTVAVAGLRYKPHHFEVDPYNGYLFWVTKTGLYRLDLADISNGIKHTVKPELIFHENNLGAFTVDHTNFSILVAHQNKNTIYSVSLDGKEVSNMRPKITTSRLQKVISLASAHKKFYWTDGNEVLYEEYHNTSSDNSVYFHNSYPLQVSKSYIKVLVNLTSSQPTPVPVNPPTAVQAIFGNDLAKASWQPPHLLGAQGKGAWQNWSYEIYIKDLKTQKYLKIDDINSTSFTIRNLLENTDYLIKSAAYTSFGKGPWSTAYIGQTLKENRDGRKPVILWSAQDGLLKSDASGENVETIIHKSLMGSYPFNDIAWFEDQLYLVDNSNSSQVFWYNMTSHKHGTLGDVNSVGSIAVDWVGKKLYWSNPKQHLIIRGNLHGTQQEPLPIVTLAKELNIDSINGYIYWTTGYAIESTRLNGAEHYTYHSVELFVGKHMTGLTLDMDHKLVYWIVRDSDGSDLYSAPMAGSSNFIQHRNFPKKVDLMKPSKQCLCYFSNRLIWLQDDRSAVISDLKGQYTASISGKNLLELNMVYVMDSSQQVMPNASKFSSIKGISVIPEMIDKHSVRVSGTWDSFNITWKPIQNVNYGTVFYEIKFDNLSSNDSVMTTTFPTLRYTKIITPYTKLHVSLRAFTYWGSSAHTRVKIHSPPSTPSAPRNPRAYVIYQHHHVNMDEINVTLRWDPPANSNGVLEGYKVIWWYFERHQILNDSAIVDATDKEYVVGDLRQNKTYYFQVQAFTEIGDGNLSPITEIHSEIESPIPTLLVASPDSLYIKDVDVNQNYSLIRGISTPIEMDYLFSERKVYWINDMQELLVFNLANLNRSRIYSVNGNAISLTALTVDWIERSIFYVQLDEMKGSALYKIDLNQLEKGITKNQQIFRTPYVIRTIEVSPFSSKLYWVESDRLMQANTDGSNVTTFFAETINNNSCNCPISHYIEHAFTVDHSNIEKPSIIFIDSSTKYLMSSDRDGCNCEILSNSTFIKDSLPIETLKTDFNNIFWTNKSKILYSLNRSSNVFRNQFITAMDVLIFGSHMQPYPSTECLTPKLDKLLSVSLINKSSTSLNLRMPTYSMNEGCENFSIATIEYKIFYMPYNDGDDTQCDEMCTQNITFDKYLEIQNLRPFSKYVISVALRNFYSNEDLFIGPGMVFQTEPGAPSPPRNVLAQVLNPNVVKVSWLPPTELNGDLVNYIIHWQTEGFITGVRRKGEKTVDHKEPNSNQAYLDNLLPNQTYSISVRANSRNNLSSSDVLIKIRTFPEPNNLTLENSKSNKLVVTWNISKRVETYKMQYSPVSTNDWNMLDVRIYDDVARAMATNLKPKTQYKFRLTLKYPDLEELYVWPKDGRFTFETKGDRPSPPGIPIIQHVKEDVYQVWWEASKDNGAPILNYNLETLKMQNYRNKRSTANRTAWFSSGPAIEETEFEWESIYNGTDTFWKIALPENHRYSFRVSAVNSYGWSDYSEESIQFDPLASAPLENRSLLVYVIITIIPMLLICCSFFIFKCCKMCCCSRNKHKEQEIIKATRGPDVELATLRELPRRGNFIHNTNVLYVSTQPTIDELTLLPHIGRNQITLKKFLGSGAFGEVFEGEAIGINGGNAETKVAVKTLRKGASDQEKSEFLQEAQLMSHFKHEHILQLLGVCLDNDPHFIIMELMQGGDLLTYLRSSRKPGVNSPSLNLLDLLSMCVDVAKGCRYLEEMHFVHRDLACRNCLVSSTDPETRIVKIGDFGLARDIYKNDYYRKEGEGLLPVRWMAPESLVDGVFTCQSDVWAFGVLLWEIMTLGQQPYPARTNLEVLHYVRNGGRLGKPMDCPEALHSLMLKCWSYDTENRPTFKYCLEDLLALQQQHINSPMTGAHTGQYISTVPQLLDGISNRAYFQDENHNHSGASWKSGTSEETSKERTPFLKNEVPTEIPKYLELLYDSDCPVENDGYEVPIKQKTEVESDTVGYTTMSNESKVENRKAKAEVS